MTASLVDGLRQLMDPSSMQQLMATFEDRPEQRQMAEEVLQALLEQHVTMIEAGTGTGKSLAYLLPALLFASVQGEQVIVATNTITLQEQLLHKDIPMALKLLKKEMHVVLAKGMGNYVCQEKLHRMTKERSFQIKRTEEEDTLCSWCETTASGSRSELPFRVSNDCWEKVAADVDTCSTCSCKHSSTCFFLAARRSLQEAHLIVTNHHLLFADLVRRVETGNQEENCILPPLKRLIIDEAHHLEDVATEFFAQRAMRVECAKLLFPFCGDSHDRRGSKVSILFSGPKKKADQGNPLQTLEEIVVRARQAQQALDAVFDAVEELADQLFSSSSSGSDGVQKCRLKAEHSSHAVFCGLKDQLVPVAEDRVMALCAVWRGAASSLSLSRNEKKRAVKVELDLVCQRLTVVVGVLNKFFTTCGTDGTVHWLERHQKRGATTLVQVAFDLSATLREHLFSPSKTTVLCSATLTSGKGFDFYQSRLGITEPQLDHPVRGIVYPSPFDYEHRSLFAIPVDIPAPDTKEYVDLLAHHCAELIEASGGGTLILFTSYASLQATFERTKELLRNSSLQFFKQGDLSRRLTIDGFRSVNNGVLFATASFWEGVDIPGAALRSVIITKLPFDVPSEPLAEARAEALKRRGQNPFFTYSLPRACVRFKQAFGRLIRRKDDKGAVICLDNRLLTKPYGKAFLNALPPCPVIKMPFADLMRSLREFYRT